MVKALIRGLMGRKSSDKEKGALKEEIPDELPPLAEDAAKEEQEKARLEAEKKAKEKEEQEELKEDVPEELIPIEEKFVKEEPEETKEISKLKEGLDEAEEKRGGFFSNLLRITKKQGLNKKLLDKNLYKGMKDYYSLKPSVDIKSITKKELEDNVTAKLDELKLLEKNWQKQKEFVEKNKQILLEDEKKIKEKSEELRPLLKRLSFYEEVPVGKYFRSDDGVIAKNVFELLNLLGIMDEKVFKNHVNKNKNDFALWVRNIVGDKELAVKLSKAGSKKDMISLLENASAGKT